MKSSIITLFAEAPAPRRGPSPFVVSLVVHGVAFTALFLGMKERSRTDEHALLHRYTVRIMELQQVEQHRKQMADVAATKRAGEAASPAAQGQSGSTSMSASPSALANLQPAEQTLIQPDAPPDRLLPQEAVVPFVLMWSPEDSVSKTIVAPPPQERTVAEVRPSILIPNREPDLADIKMSATQNTTDNPLMRLASTSPVVVRGPEAARRIPSTASSSAGMPTAARILSLSSLKMTNGPVAIPLANVSLPSASSSGLSPGSGAKSGTATGSGSGGAGNTGDGYGSSTSSIPSTSNSPGGGTRQGLLAGNGSQGQDGKPGGGNLVAQGGGNPTSDTGADVESTAAPKLQTRHITQPKDGHFGVVVVGSSLTEQYPEIVRIWNNRLVYTVYLHAGPGKNWILQYSIPRTEENVTEASSARPESPWPYDIYRPVLDAADFNSDAVLVHGFINILGKFERLAVVFPTEFTQAKFLLDALKQWHFRPAQQNDKVAAVEVLLIIPAEVD